MYAEQCEVFIDHKNMKCIFTEKELNMRHKRWLELLNNYAITIKYHPVKENKVADGLCRKSYSNLTPLITMQKKILMDLSNMDVQVCARGALSMLAYISVEPTLISRIKSAQSNDSWLLTIRGVIESDN